MDILHAKRNGDREITPQSLWLHIAKLLLCIHESIVNNSYSLFVIKLHNLRQKSQSVIYGYFVLSILWGLLGQIHTEQIDNLPQTKKASRPILNNKMRRRCKLKRSLSLQTLHLSLSLYLCLSLSVCLFLSLSLSLSLSPYKK